MTIPGYPGGSSGVSNTQKGFKSNAGANIKGENQSYIVTIPVIVVTEYPRKAAQRRGVIR